MIPERTLEALKRYAEDGVPTGGFLRAVLSNDLITAVRFADDENSAALVEIVRHIFWQLPANIWGSPETIDRWIRLHREAREKKDGGSA